MLHGPRAGCGEGLAVAIRATRTLSRTGASFRLRRASCERGHSIHALRASVQIIT
ncbi:hypothetical protein C7S16_4848 [Burkholderia thailandensis]|uniref:Uncharacterized protein n=1 Tax=Burkholderia thailandensis TaxID=57975 RepID=A0AAW9CQ60_BURTH|nr:hypothetical protein [Burkholderia thailandensis]MDW9252562.1 hypothetical protein [Burkholderia thailandensis]